MSAHIKGVVMAEYAETLALCRALYDAGLWLRVADNDLLSVGPTPVARQHPELLTQLRRHKPTILAILRETLAYQVLTETTLPAEHFVTEICPECHQPSLVVAAPRRLAMHRMPDGTAVCPGAARAQNAAAQTVMVRFLAERCVQRPGAALTWIALRGALESWACEVSWLLPPRPYLIAWMDAHYTRLSSDEVYASWKGLTFTLREWLGEDEPVPAGTMPTHGPKPKPVLRA
jgi:hypothetical protein